MSDHSTFLFATPSFWEGVARLGDVTGALNRYNVTLAPDDADIRAARNDWQAVGDDIRAAIGRFAGELEHSH